MVYSVVVQSGLVTGGWWWWADGDRQDWMTLPVHS